MIPVSIAPMMDWTDRHYRYFARRLTRKALLYTEMITAAAILFGDRDRLLGFHPEEHPISLQMGGDSPEQLARAIELAEPRGYDEYNLNVGCPSDRVRTGNFGACLMADPPRVASLVRAMQAVTDRPVTVKHRIGIDGLERYEDMLRFVDTLAAEGITRFTVHARIAILQGLSPRDNRTIPPLRYEEVYRLKRERPDLEIEINGGIKTLEEVREHRRHVDAVMIGRAAYANPSMLAGIDGMIGAEGDLPGRTREEVVREMIPYLRDAVAAGSSPRAVFNPMLGLFAGRPGARYWKRGLSGRLPEGLPPEEILEAALSSVPAEIRGEPLPAVGSPPAANSPPAVRGITPEGVLRSRRT
ncbi:MAG: tRNA dihydrouridine(20/20a) synthase DusA [Spirochaetaceae bacterium]|nr:MAG: tRNA dihydrouridine(20/20a) synthase DusA [Spirochaetaceae bacterium]